jgi:hypothetical protein
MLLYVYKYTEAIISIRQFMEAFVSANRKHKAVSLLLPCLDNNLLHSNSLCFYVTITFSGNIISNLRFDGFVVVFF